MTAALGFGVSGPHGQAWFSERKVARLVAQAVDGGVRHFDTAPFYGNAEARLGRALRDIGARDIIVSTKTGTRRAGGRVIKDFSAQAIRADAEASLKSLSRDALDALFLHGPARAEIDAALPALLALKAEGKVKAIGVCGEGAALDHALAQGFDAIMGVFNLVERRHADIFSLAKSKGVLTFAIAPLAQGAFDERRIPTSASGVWRALRGMARGGPAAPATQRAKEALQTVEGVSASGAALAFVLQGAFADVALTTTTNPAHLAESLDAARRVLPADAMARLSAAGLDPALSRS
jgi:aryl-alcohol dehydrogenase-like predicted oxidoreductase